MAKQKSAAPVTTDTGRGFAGRAFQRIQGIIDDTGGQAWSPITCARSKKLTKTE